MRSARAQLVRRWTLLSLSVLLASTALAGISHAETSLCKPDEQTLWSCSAKSKTYSVCASGDLDGASGYMQYRAGTMSAIELSYPEGFRHPKGAFAYSLLAKGASLEFENKGYQYAIYEPLMGAPSIVVSQASRELASIQCDTSTDTLTLTTTIDQLKAVGIVE